MTSTKQTIPAPGGAVPAGTDAPPVAVAVRPAVGVALEGLSAAVEALLTAADDYADGATDMALLLLPLLERTPADRSDPDVQERWVAGEAAFWAEAAGRPADYTDGARSIAASFAAVCHAALRAQSAGEARGPA